MCLPAAEALKGGSRDKYIVATKFGFVLKEDGTVGVRGDAQHVRFSSLEQPSSHAALIELHQWTRRVHAAGAITCQCLMR